MITVTREMFEEWSFHPVTKKLMKRLQEEREEMKEGLVVDLYDHPDVVKGMCRATSNILRLEYEDLFESKEVKSGK